MFRSTGTLWKIFKDTVRIPAKRKPKTIFKSLLLRSLKTQSYDTDTHTSIKDMNPINIPSTGLIILRFEKASFRSALYVLLSSYSCPFLNAPTDTFLKRTFLTKMTIFLKTAPMWTATFTPLKLSG